MMAGLTLRDLVEWDTYYGLEPDAGDKVEWMLARLLQLIERQFELLRWQVSCAVSTSKPQAPEPKKIEDYLVRFGDNLPTISRRQTAREQWAILKGALMAHTAGDKRRQARSAERKKDRPPVIVRPRPAPIKERRKR